MGRDLPRGTPGLVATTAQRRYIVIMSADLALGAWHGDRFALEDGRNLSERACRLQSLTFVQFSASGEASLHLERPDQLESGGA